jgi:hypothetical protein
MTKQERISNEQGQHIGSVARVPWPGLPAWCIAGTYSGGRYETRDEAIAELRRRHANRDIDALGRSLSYSRHSAT